MASALARKQRQGVLTVEQRAALTANWAAIAGASTRTAIEYADFDFAAKLVDAGPRGLRSEDALHLALVRRAGLALATLDRDLADAAEATGAEVALRPPA